MQTILARDYERMGAMRAEVSEHMRTEYLIEQRWLPTARGDGGLDPLRLGDDLMSAKVRLLKRDAQTSEGKLIGLDAVVRLHVAQHCGRLRIPASTRKRCRLYPFAAAQQS